VLFRTAFFLEGQKFFQDPPAAFLHIPACGTPDKGLQSSVIQKNAFTKGGTAVYPGKRLSPEIPGHG
jgi:hypothetical protein